jgi:beta-galactosidase/beta-glucuronidase
MGITGDIYLQATDTKNTSQIDFDLFGVNVRKSLDTTSNSWLIDFNLKFSQNRFELSNTDQQIYFRLLNTDWSYTTRLTSLRSSNSINANYQSVTVTLAISSHHIELWWPNGYGHQPLYEFQVEYQSQLKTKLIAFRTIELVQENYTDLGLNGTSFYFKVNNQTIFIKGSNWVPADAFQERITRGYLEMLLTSTAEANINMLRVWGGGVYEKDDFYELTDQLGIMIWQDFMFSDSL